MSEELAGRHIWLTIPTYTGTVHVETMRSVIDDMLDVANAGCHVTLVDESGNAMIAHGRDVLCAKFLADETATDLIFIDHDVVWPKGTIRSLMLHPVEVVGAVYPKRADPLGFHCRYLDKPYLEADPENGLLEVAGVSAGCLRIARSCLEKMIEAYPEKAFNDKNAPNGEAWGLFDNIHEDRAYFGEDYSFCERFRRIGGRIWVEPEIEMAHIGFKTFRGSFGKWLRERADGENLLQAAE